MELSELELLNKEQATISKHLGVLKNLANSKYQPSKKH